MVKNQIHLFSTFFPLALKIKHGQNITESYRTRQKIIRDPTPSISSSICDPTPSISSSTCDPTTSTPSHATRSNDTYAYGVGILVVLAIGACLFFAYNTFQPKRLSNDCLVAHHEEKKLLKRRHIL